MDCKEYCAALLLDLSKAFDTVDRVILVNRLKIFGLSVNVVSWSSNYLSARTQCVHVAGCSPSFCPVSKGVPQGSILGPLLFSPYINNLSENLSNIQFHLFADDTVIYSSSPSAAQLLKFLQYGFDFVQFHLTQPKFVLNAEKSNFMLVVINVS